MDPKPHQLMTCPFNPAHQVEKYKMQLHIEKCRKQYQQKDKLICPFDSTHICTDVEFDYHVLHCNKRAMFDQIKYIVEDNVQRPAAIPPPGPTPTPATAFEDENWDNEFCSTYVPDPAKKGAHIITKIKGATPSERRKARMEGIKNYRPLENK